MLKLISFLRKKVVVPVWFLFFGAFSLTVAIINRLLVPSVRWFFRSRANEVIHNVNDRLAIRLPEFTLTKRKELVGRLVYDPQVLATVDAEARDKNIPRAVLVEKAEKYAREIVPTFNAYVYFRLGISLSTILTDALYNVRLGFVDQDNLIKLNHSEDSLMFVMNHRSHMDYVLLGHIAHEYAALSFAVGEWANFFPIKQLLSAMGGFFVRRKSGKKLYRKVLERYVQMAMQGGVTQAMYPEGRLTRDGHLQEPRLGLLDYMLRISNTNNEHDLYLIPVAVNYDLVLEDDTQVRAGMEDAPKFSRVEKLRGILDNVRLLQRRGLHGFGYAVVNVGAPISLREFALEHGIEFDQLPKPERIEYAKKLAQVLMETIGELVPVLPVSVLANVFLAHDGWISAETLLEEKRQLLDQLSANGAQIFVPDDERAKPISTSLSLLVQRGLIESADNQFRAVPEMLPLLNYYANSISHLFDQPVQLLQQDAN